MRQDEVDIVETAYSTIVVVVPGMGDEIQAIKAGIFEIADIFVINKADHEGVEKTPSDLSQMLDLNNRNYEQGLWKPLILKTQANTDKGIRALVGQIEKHSEYLKQSSGAPVLRRGKAQVRRELSDMIKIQGCMACYKCFENRDGQCVFKDEEGIKTMKVLGQNTA